VVIKPLLAALVLLAVIPQAGPPPAQRPEPPTGAIALVVHLSNPVNNLSISDLRRIFMMETQNWPHGRKITVVLGEKGQPGRAEVIRRICGISEAEYDRHILLQTFRGAIGLGPRTIRDTAAMLRFIFNAPGSIGYAPSDQVNNNSTKVLRIEGLAPSDLRYPLRLRGAGASRPPPVE
jgi:ABC-type phosphate transport system substrate-binding protein